MGKQVVGRKRHVAVDMLGLPLAVQVQPASMQDPTGSPPVIAEAKRYAPRLEVVKKPAGQKGFQILPHGWVVERTFGCFGKYRRLAGRDFETNPRNSEAWIKLFMCNLLVRRLTSPLKWQRKKEYLIGLTQKPALAGLIHGAHTRPKSLV